MIQPICCATKGDSPRVVFFGRKPGGAVALRVLHAMKWNVIGVVVPDNGEPDWLPSPHVRSVASELGLPVVTQGELRDKLQGDSLRRPHFLMSYLYPSKIMPDVLRFPEIAAINFHPGPLPRLGGWGQYIHTIVSGSRSYGVACHVMTDELDRGAVIARREFKIDPTQETALSLERKSQYELLALFHEVCSRILNGETLEVDPRPLERYVSRAEVEAIRLIPGQCSAEEIAARARAFWYPPYPGASLSSLGDGLTIVPSSVLKDIGEDIHRSDYEGLWQLGRSLIETGQDAVVHLEVRSAPQDPLDRDAGGSPDGAGPGDDSQRRPPQPGLL